MKRKIDDTRRLDASRKLGKLRKKKLWRSLIETGTDLLQESDDGQSARIHAEVANAYREVRQYDLAREHIAAATSLRPDNLVVLRRFAELESAEGNFEAAAALWQSLRKKQGKRTQRTVFLNLARAQRHLGQLDAARATTGDGCARYPGGTKLRRELQLITSM